MRDVFQVLGNSRPTQAQIQDERRRANQQPGINEAQVTADAALVQPPIGAGMEWYSEVLPEDGKWLWSDGGLYDSLEFPELYAAIGTRWNTGGEATGMFRTPDRRNRVGVGVGPARTVGGIVLVTRALGALFGRDTVTLDSDEMPDHDHGGATNSSTHSHSGSTDTDSHSHNLNFNGKITANMSYRNDVDTWDTAGGDSGLSWAYFTSLSTTSDEHSHSLDINSNTHSHPISSDGGNQPHENAQPSIAVYFIIRAKP